MNINTIVLAVFGLLFLLFAKKIAKLIFRFSPDSRFNTPLLRNLFIVLPILGIGLMCFISAFIISKSIPMHANLKRDKSRLLLLEKGIITQGMVNKVFYQIGSPAGWKVVYKFNTNNPKTGQPENYIGSSQGPEKFYKGLDKGSPISVIYDPCYPELNCEVRCFLNKPSFRHTFKKADKLYLLDRFKGKYEIESYTFREWYSQQQGWKK
jgi:hypothetical protein